MKSFALAIIAFLLMGCYSTTHLLKKNDTLIGKSLPRKVEKTFGGSLRSTQIFSDKDAALIFVLKDEESLKKVKKPNVYAWRIADVRFKPWYVPGFIYNGKYSSYKSVMVGSTKSLLDSLKIRQGNWVIELKLGKITNIMSLSKYLGRKTDN